MYSKIYIHNHGLWKEGIKLYLRDILVIIIYKLTWCPSLFKDNFPKNQDELQTLQIVHIYIHTHILNTIYCLYCSNTNYSRVRVTVTLTNDWWSQGLQSITPDNAILET